MVGPLLECLNYGDSDLKGIILAGGRGTRLYPITKSVSKQLLPVYDKPMIFYPLSVLMLSGIKEVLIISSPDDLQGFKLLFGDGTKFGMQFSFVEQPSPDGVAQALSLGAEFLDGDSACLILGDNIFFGHDLESYLAIAVKNVEDKNVASLFTYSVSEPERYGVADIDPDGSIVGLEEKPIKPRSNLAVVGLYFYPSDVVSLVTSVKPSHRGELEITSLNQIYMDAKRLRGIHLGRGHAWFDAGTHDSLLDASNFIQTIENRQGLKIACLEEIAFNQGFIDIKGLQSCAEGYSNTAYGFYLKSIIDRQTTG